MRHAGSPLGKSVASGQQTPIGNVSSILILSEADVRAFTPRAAVTVANGSGALARNHR